LDHLEIFYFILYIRVVLDGQNNTSSDSL